MLDLGRVATPIESSGNSDHQLWLVKDTLSYFSITY